jgi:HEAT repeat protein
MRRPLLRLLLVTAIAAHTGLQGCDRSPDEASVRADALAVATALLEDPSVYTRLMAAGILLDAGEARGWPIVVAGLYDADLITRRAAAGALLDVRSPSVIPIVEDLTSRDEAFENVFFKELPHHPRLDADSLVRRGLASQSPAVVMLAINAVTLARRPDLLSWVEDAVERSSADPWVRAQAFHAQVALGHSEEAEGELLALATNADSSLRETAAVALGHVKSADARSALAGLSEDESARVRVAALASRLAVGDEGAAGSFESVLRGSDASLAELAAGGVKRLPAERSLALVDRSLDCCPLEPQVAMRLLESVGWLAGGDAREVLGWGMAQSDPLIRMQAIWAIGARRDADELPLAVAALEDVDSGARAMAAWALIRGDGRVPRLPDPPSSLFRGSGI